MALKLSGKRVLVVGGAGFVGSNLVRLLLAEDPTVTVTVIDNLLSSERTNVPEDPRVYFVEGSISNDRVLSGIQDEFHFIFHLATFHGNQSSIHDPIRDHENNTLTTLKLLHHVRAFRMLQKCVYSSAGCSVAKKTFDDAVATTEEAPLSIEQDSPYSISKVIGEFYSVYFHRQHGVPTVRARFQNVYGPGEILGAGEWRGTPASVWRNVTPTFIYKALRGLPLPLENEGRPTRDFIFVKDVVRGLLACAIAGTPGDVYNIATGKETSIRALSETINRLTENSAGVEEVPGRPWDSSGKRFGSGEKAATEIGFRASVPLEDGLRETVEWTRKHLPQIESCMRRHVDAMPPDFSAFMREG